MSTPAFCLSLVDSGLCVVQERRRLAVASEEEDLSFANLLSANVSVLPATPTETTVAFVRIAEPENDTTVVNHTEFVGRYLTHEPTERISLFLEGTEADSQRLLVLPPRPQVEIVEEDDIEERFCTVVAHVRTSAPDTEQDFDLLYTLEGFKWTATYTVVIDEHADSFHLSGRYNLTNPTEVTFSAAQISLLKAGQQAKEPYKKRKSTRNKTKRKPANYGRRRSGSGEVDLSQQSTVAFAVAEAVDIFPGTNTVPFAHGLIQPVNKHFLVTFGGSGHRVQQPQLDSSSVDYPQEVFGNEAIEIQNAEAQGLGLRLPAGKVQVLHANGQPDNFDIEDIGEELIGTTEKNEFITVKLRGERNLKGRRERVRITRDDKKKTLTEELSLSVKNTSCNPIATIVEDTLGRWKDWKITLTSSDFHPNGKSKARWITTVMPNTTETITYTVQYTWE